MMLYPEMRCKACGSPLLFSSFRSQASASASRDQLEERERAHLKDLKRGRGDEDVTGLLEDGTIQTLLFAQ
jgi:hypothetical protein